ncbi:MAG: LysR family transcriptional regulator [Spirochaetaceae bacterium]|nr:LysR family transcriptional regulator [Spirochaetaceae bacterium]
MLERSHLEIIEALDRRGSLTKAADELHLTQSALTHSIRKLEEMTGSVIWKKEGRGLRLTGAGELILQSAKRLLPQFVSIDDHLAEYGTGRKGKLTIGVECHPCFEWLVHMVHKYLEKWPDIDLDVTREFQFDGLDALENHKVNMIVSPDYVPGDSLLHIGILDFELQLMTGPDNDLVHKEFISPGDLNNQTLYTYPVSKSRLDIFKLNINPEKHIPVEAAEIMVQLVAAGRGVSTFPDWLIKRYAEEFNVRGVPITKEGLKKKLYLVIRKEDRNIPFINSFIELAGKSRNPSA